MHNLTAGDFLGVVSPNTPPDATNATASGNEDTTIPITLTGTDSDGTIASVTVNTLLPNGTLYVDVGLTMVVSPGATFSGSSMTLYFKPDANFNGGVSFQFTVTDDDGASDATPATASITVNSVNDAPVAADDTASVDEDGVLAGASVLGNDDDSHGGAPSENNLPLTAVLVDDVAHGALVLTADGTFTYTPDGDFNGTDSFTYQAKDSLGGVSNTATVTITVNSVNDAPVNTVPVAQVVNEDTNLSITGLSVSDVDAGGGTITVTLSVLHGTLTISTSVLGGLGGSNVAGNGTGSVTLTGTLTQINTTLAALNAVVYRGNLNYNGPDTLTMTSNDQGDTGSPGPLTDTDTVAITVNPVNDAPTAVNDTWIISKNTTAIMPALVLVGNDTDPDGDHLMIVSVGAATNGGLVSLNADGTITYISNGVGVSNTDTFTYTVSDGHGGTSTATANISIVDVGSAATGDNVLDLQRVLY